MADFKISRNQTGNNTSSMSHDARVEFIDNTQQVLTRLNANAGRATLAVGTTAVGMIVSQMQTGYGKPIRKIGDLQRKSAVKLCRK